MIPPPTIATSYTAVCADADAAGAAAVVDWSGGTLAFPGIAGSEWRGQLRVTRRSTPCCSSGFPHSTFPVREDDDVTAVKFPKRTRSAAPYKHAHAKAQTRPVFLVWARTPLQSQGQQCTGTGEASRQLGWLWIGRSKSKQVNKWCRGLGRPGRRLGWAPGSSTASAGREVQGACTGGHWLRCPRSRPVSLPRPPTQTPAQAAQNWCTSKAVAGFGSREPSCPAAGSA
jgi:hypothetical protein